MLIEIIKYIKLDRKVRDVNVLYDASIVTEANGSNKSGKPQCFFNGKSHDVTDIKY